MASLSKQPYITPTVAVDYATLANLTEADGWNELAPGQVLEMGLGWDKSTGGSGGLLGWVNKKAGSDLDGVATFYVGDRPVKYLGWDELDTFADEGNAAGSAVHTGDNQTGEGGGDDETIRLALGNIPVRITSIMLNATAFKHGSSMRRAKNIKVTLYDSTGGTKEPVAWIEPSLLNPKNTIGVAVLRRKRDDSGAIVPGAWQLKVLDRSVDVTQGNRDDFLIRTAQLMQQAQ
jgi:tellurium resistance protein TerZ